MAPNANLAEQRRIVALALAGTAKADDFERLAALVVALDEWLTNKGSLPTAWERDALAKARARALYVDTACLPYAARLASIAEGTWRHRQATNKLATARADAANFFDEEMSGK